MSADNISALTLIRAARDALDAVALHEIDFCERLEAAGATAPRPWIELARELLAWQKRRPLADALVSALSGLRPIARGDLGQVRELVDLRSRAVAACEHLWLWGDEWGRQYQQHHESGTPLPPASEILKGHLGALWSVDEILQAFEEAVRAEHPSPPTAATACIVWHGGRAYSLGGGPQHVVAPNYHAILQAFLRANVEAMDTTGLKTLSGCPNVSEAFGGLRKSYGRAFATALIPAGKKGGSGYRARVRCAPGIEPPKK